jgi:hypothetical protein
MALPVGVIASQENKSQAVPRCFSYDFLIPSDAVIMMESSVQSALSMFGRDSRSIIVNQPITARVSELEGRVALLTNVAIGQMVALAYFLGLLGIMALAAVVLLPILAFTHKRIPALAKRFGRLFS